MTILCQFENLLQLELKYLKVDTIKLPDISKLSKLKRLIYNNTYFEH